MELDPKAKALLTAIVAAGETDIDAVPLNVAREQIEKRFTKMKIPVKPVDSILDSSFEGTGGEIAVRIYTPAGKGPFPVIVFFHGGGWALFHLDTYDPICTHICDTAESIVVSVDYRLAPENKFPAATDDCLAATRWIGEHCKEWNGDPSRTFLAGDSAGGNLATVTALRIRDEGGPTISGQVLIYPVTDYFKPEKSSYLEFAEGFGLTENDMYWFWDKYLDSEKDASNPMAAPLLAPDLSGLPPALVIVSGYDPLRDEGIAYAHRMKDAGIPVTLSVYHDMIHGFLSYLGILKQANEVIFEIEAWLKKHK